MHKQTYSLKIDLPSVKLAWTGLQSHSWQHGGPHLWFCQCSPPPPLASWVRSRCLANKEYLIACSKENLLIGSRLDYLTCFHFAFILKKSIKTGGQIKQNPCAAVFESSRYIFQSLDIVCSHPQESWLIRLPQGFRLHASCCISVCT